VNVERRKELVKIARLAHKLVALFLQRSDRLPEIHFGGGIDFEGVCEDLLTFDPEKSMIAVSRGNRAERTGFSPAPPAEVTSLRD
jgi:hypothetical protein